jgi:O-methyltransferase domain
MDGSVRTADLIKVDALTPFALLAARTAGADLQRLIGAGLMQMDTAGSRLYGAVLRHIILFGRYIMGLPAGDQIVLGELIRASEAYVRRALADPDPLQRFLARKRAELPTLISVPFDGGADRGRATWEEIRRDPELSMAFDDHMIARSTTLSAIWSDLFTKPTGLIADIGGGPGQYLASALLSAGQQWRGTLIDNYDAAGWLVMQSDVGSRVEAAHVDALADTLPAADVYIVASVIHDLSDRDAMALLRNCFTAGNERAYLILIERSFEPSSIVDSARDLDIRLLFGGRERSHAEYSKMVSRSGFGYARGFSTLDHYQVVAAVKTSR